MTLRYKQQINGACIWLSLTALFLSGSVMLAAQVVSAQTRDHFSQELPSGNNQDESGFPAFRKAKQGGAHKKKAEPEFGGEPPGFGDNDGSFRRAQFMENRNRQENDLPGWGMRRMKMDAIGDGASAVAPGQNFPGGMLNRPFHPGGPGQGGASFNSRQLDLTPLSLSEEQKDRVRQMRQQTRLKVRDLHKEVLQRQSGLRKLIFDPDASEADIRSARSQLRQMQDQVDEANMNDLLAIRALLTAEQRKHLPDCLPSRRATGYGAPGQPPGAFPGGPGGKQSAEFNRRSLEAASETAREK